MTVIGSEIAATSPYAGAGSANSTSSSADFSALLEKDVAKDSTPEEIQYTRDGQTFTARRLSAVLKPIPISEMPEEMYQQLTTSMERMLEMKYSKPPEAPDLSNYDPIKTYATVTVGGRVVATIDNQGCVSSSNAVGARLQSMLEQYADVNGTNGPDLAQLRADKIAAMLGGKVQKANTAMSQSTFNAYPPFEPPKPVVDYAAMKQDPMYQSILKHRADRAAWLAKQSSAEAAA